MREKIERIHILFEEINDVFNSLSIVEKEKLLDIHHYDKETLNAPYIQHIFSLFLKQVFSLAHCIRWGCMSTQEILDMIDKGEEPFNDVS